MQPAVLRPWAEQDLIAISRWYIGEGGLKLDERAFDAVRKALLAIERMPGLGSPTIGQRCGLSDLRHWGVKKFPMRWFISSETAFWTWCACWASAKLSRRYLPTSHRPCEVLAATPVHALGLNEFNTCAGLVYPAPNDAGYSR